MNAKTMIAVLAAAVVIAGAVSVADTDVSAADDDSQTIHHTTEDKKVDFGGLLVWLTIILLVFAIACVAMAIYCKLYNAEY